MDNENLSGMLSLIGMILIIWSLNRMNRNKKD